MQRCVLPRRSVLFKLIVGFIGLFPLGLGLHGQTTLTTGTYNGQSYPGDVIIASSNTVTFTGGTTFVGPNLTLNTSSTLNWNQTGALSGDAISFANNASLSVGGGNTLTIGVGPTVTGDISITSAAAGAVFINQGSITHTASSNNGAIFAPTFTNQGSITSTGANDTLALGSSAAEIFTNAASGTITADGSGVVVSLLGVDNQGALIAQNSGQLRLTGPNTTAELGTVQLLTGGRALLTGTLDNTAATLNPVTGGLFELFGGTINNGTIAGIGFTSSGGTVNNATFTSQVSLATSAAVTFAGANTFNGATATFANNATITIGGSSTFTVGSGSSATGDLAIESSAAGAVFINQGSITHTVSSNNGDIFAPTFTFLGAITSTGANDTLALGSSAAE